jgi:hypothetical protein
MISLIGTAKAIAASPFGLDTPSLCYVVPSLRLHVPCLLFCVMVMQRVIYCAPVFLAFPLPPPFLLFALNLPCRMAGLPDALLHMVTSNLLRLLLSMLRLR